MFVGWARRGCVTCSCRPRRRRLASSSLTRLDALGKARGMVRVGHEEREQTLQPVTGGMDGFDTRGGGHSDGGYHRRKSSTRPCCGLDGFDRHVVLTGRTR